MGGLIVILVIALFVAGLAIALLATTFAVIRAGTAHPHPHAHPHPPDDDLARRATDSGDPAISALFAADLASPPPHLPHAHTHAHGGHHHGHHHAHDPGHGGVEYGGTSPDPGPAGDPAPSFDAGPSVDAGSSFDSGSCGGGGGGGDSGGT